MGWGSSTKTPDNLEAVMSIRWPYKGFNREPAVPLQLFPRTLIVDIQLVCLHVHQSHHQDHQQTPTQHFGTHLLLGTMTIYLSTSLSFLALQIPPIKSNRDTSWSSINVLLHRGPCTMKFVHEGRGMMWHLIMSWSWWQIATEQDTSADRFWPQSN